ncbi:hypothetical protein O181_068314 [Austropuccinia psidii MF-1]|uniref:AMP-dependent synthetase/ligase domain-containing protein n=1 Tax=Austropuccinia psidii MF-1 TaxID=1389203 RepID=A0A9Q3EWN2_9BASI|nr:hypothetical protein [Austropuccinia psidii MF-1]
MSSLPPYAIISDSLPILAPSPPNLDQQSIEIPGTRKSGQTGHYKNARFPNLTTIANLNQRVPHTDYEMFNFGLGRSFDKPCLGHRPINPTTGHLESFFTWQTYQDVDRRRTNFGSGLLHLQSQQQLGQIDRTGWVVGVWTHNRPEWQITSLACSAYSLVLVSLYETLGHEVVQHCINHAEIRLVVSSANHIPDLLSNANNCPTMKVIVSADRWKDIQLVQSKSISVGHESRTLKAWGAQVGVMVIDIEELENLGRDHPLPHIPPKPSDINSLCYTSGTTGMPKGAILLHSTLAAACVSHMHGFEWEFGNDSFLSYLPLSHILERFFESIVFTLGAPIGYSSGDNLKLLEELQILKPTHFISVPRVLNRVYQAIMAQLDGPGLKAALGKRALTTKLENLKTTGSNTHILWDRLVFNKIKQLLGGRVRFIACGSAPIAPDIISFLKVAFVSKVLEGYGSTENAGTCSRCYYEDNEPAGSVGPPSPGLEVKLVDVPEMNYFSTDKPYPRGEICMRGESCIPGYYKDEAKTKELIDSEGWQHSGDIGLIDEKGRIKIIDRIKNLLKLAQGEYVALEKVQGAYSSNPLISQLYVHGNSLKSYLVGVVVPDPVGFEKFIIKVLGKSIPMDKACLEPKVRDAITKEMEQTAQSAKLLGFERIKNVHLTMEAFTVENDLLTPTFKLKRAVAASKFKQVCEKLYDEYDSKHGQVLFKL